MYVLRENYRTTVPYYNSIHCQLWIRSVIAQIMRYPMSKCLGAFIPQSEPVCVKIEAQQEHEVKTCVSSFHVII